MEQKKTSNDIQNNLPIIKVNLSVKQLSGNLYYELQPPLSITDPDYDQKSRLYQIRIKKLINAGISMFINQYLIKVVNRKKPRTFIKYFRDPNMLGPDPVICLYTEPNIQYEVAIHFDLAATK